MFSLGNDTYGYVNLVLGTSTYHNKPSVQVELIIGERGSREIRKYTSSEFGLESTYDDLRSIMRIGEDVESYLLDIGQERAMNIIETISSDIITLDYLIKTVLAQEGHFK